MANLNGVVSASVVTTGGPVNRASFGDVMIAAIGQSFASVLGKRYLSPAAVAADTELSAGLKLAAQAIWTPKSKVKAVQICEAVAEAGSGELAASLDSALAEAQGAKRDFYGLVVRDATTGDAADGDDIVAAAAWAETNEKLFIAQKADAGVLDGTTDDYSTALVTITTDDDATVPAGTLFGDGTYQWATDEEVSRTGAGDITDVAVTCTTAGAITAAIGDIDTLPASPPSGVTGVTNPAAATPGDAAIFAAIYSSSYGRSVMIYHSDDEEYVDIEAASSFLGHNPDTEHTIMCFRQLAGIPDDAANITDSQLAYLDAANVNYYLPMGGQDIVYPGVCADGKYPDEILYADWLRARVVEDLQQRLIDLTALNQSLPIDPKGLAMVEGIAQRRIDQGVEVGHFRSDEGYEPSISMPDLADVTRTSFAFSMQVYAKDSVQAIDITIRVI